MKGNLYMKLYMSADMLNVVCWWVYELYGTHWDCRNHTGAVVYMGKGVILSFSINQNMNTASSTEVK